LTSRADLQGQGYVYVIVLFTWDLQSSFFSFRREGFDLEGFSIRERKLDLRDTLSLGSDSLSL